MNTEYMDSINDKNKSLTLDDFKIALFEIWKNKSKIIIASIALTFLVALIVYFVPRLIRVRNCPRDFREAGLSCLILC